MGEIRLFFKNLSFPLKLTLSMLLVVLLAALFISVTAYTAASQPILDLESSIMLRGAEAASDQTYEYFQSLDDFCADLLRREPIAGVRSGRLSSGALDEYEDELSLLLEGSIYSPRFPSGLGIQFFSFYLEGGPAYTTLTRDTLPYGSYAEWDEYLQTLDSTGGVVNNSGWYGPLSLRTSSPNKQSCCLYIRSIYSTGGRRMGILVTGVAEVVISELYGTASPEGCIITRDGTVLSSPQAAVLGTVLDSPDIPGIFQQYASGSYTYHDPDGKAKGVIYRILPGNASCLLLPTSAPSEIKSEKLYRFAASTVAIVLAAMLLSALLALLLSRRLTGSILTLKGVVQQVYEGDLGARYTPSGNDEIAYLGLKINDMLEQVEDFFLTQEQDAAEKRNLELRLLQAQINPHLIYNTLSSTIWALRSNDTEKAQRLIFLLSDFFRLSLSNGMELVPLETELELIRNYVALQRLLKRAEYELLLDVEERLLRCPILCMTLQPLVENSIRHGFYEMAVGRIRITGRLADSGRTMELKVIDDGAGIPPETVAELNRSFSDRAPLAVGQSHYGLYNINRRILNKYGPGYGLSVDSELDERTECTILLPYLSGAAGGNEE